jgi:ribonuclease T2
MRKTVVSVGLWFGILAGGAAQAQAQDRPAQFDHYLLALTWTPEWCATEGAARGDDRCAPGARLGWIVHGLWPQHADGRWPEYCLTAHPAPSRRQTAEAAAIFGASGAAWHQWNKHGRCTGLSAADYYALTERAASRIVFPPVFTQIDQPLRIAPDVVEAAFIEANPALGHDMMVTTCRGGEIAELRLCLTRDLDPRPCDTAMLQRECRARSAVLAPPN